jgi:hypothetical protein
MMGSVWVLRETTSYLPPEVSTMGLATFRPVSSNLIGPKNVSSSLAASASANTRTAAADCAVW